MNLNSFIGYCCGVSYVMKDKLDQALDDERILTNQNLDEAEVMQRQTQRQAGQANNSGLSGRISLASTVPGRMPPINPQNTDILARMIDRATAMEQHQQQGLLGQMRAALSNPAGMSRVLNNLLGQMASVFFGGRRLQETDQAARDKRTKAEEAAERENPGLLLLDVDKATGMNPGKQ